MMLAKFIGVLTDTTAFSYRILGSVLFLKHALVPSAMHLIHKHQTYGHNFTNSKGYIQIRYLKENKKENKIKKVEHEHDY
jgi:hypothetical protein